MPDQWQICQKYRDSNLAVLRLGQRVIEFLRRKGMLIVLCLCAVTVTLMPAFSTAAILPVDTVQNGGYIISRNGKVIESYRANDRFTPASTIKLLTALTAFEFLGEDYRFTTSFYTDDYQNLYVQGSGDPLLTSESIARIAVELKKRGVETIRSYILDDSLFQLETSQPEGSLNSENPYDAPNGALAVNFNSVSIVKKKNGTIGSGESQTPTTVLAKEIGSKLPNGKHRINIGAYDIQGNISSSLRYSAELMHSIFNDTGINSTLEFRQGKIPKTARKIVEYTSDKTVKDIVRLCMHYSNNFLANQLALVAGGEMYGYPATWEKARKALSYFATQQIGIPDNELLVKEGSGLSRATYITPKAMMSIVDAFTPHRDLLPIKHGYHLKSGTLEDVYCYAGYLDTPGGLVTFSLLLNQPTNNRNQLIRTIRKKLSIN